MLPSPTTMPLVVFAQQQQQAAPSGGPTFSGMLGLACLGLACVLLYLLPLIVGTLRRHENSVGLAALTVLLGWTGVGWLLAMLWAVMGQSVPPPEDRGRRRY